MRRCPKCGKDYDARPALSRADNQTEICPECGMQEAIDAAIKAGMLAKQEREGAGT